MQILRKMPALCISVESERKIHWEAAAGLQQALGFSWLGVDLRLDLGCAHVSQFAA